MVLKKYFLKKYTVELKKVLQWSQNDTLCVSCVVGHSTNRESQPLDSKHTLSKNTLLVMNTRPLKVMKYFFSLNADV